MASPPKSPHHVWASIIVPVSFALQQKEPISDLYDAAVFLVLFLGLLHLALSLLNNAEEKLGSFAMTWLHAVSGTSLAAVFALRLWIAAASVPAFCASSLVFLAAVALVLGVPLLGHLYCKRKDSVSLDKEQI